MIVFATAAIVIIVAYAHSREGVLTAAAMMVNVFIAGLLAFNFYEPLAEQLEDILANSFLEKLEDALSLVILFSLALGGLRVVTSGLASTELDLPALPQQIASVAFGAVTGYLLAGFLFCMVQTLPVGEKFLGFEYEVNSTVASGMRRLIPPDRVWLALMHRASVGPLSQESPFDPEATFELRYGKLRRTKE
jgi:hypothetical protein